MVVASCAVAVELPVWLLSVYIVALVAAVCSATFVTVIMCSAKSFFKRHELACFEAGLVGESSVSIYRAI